MGPRVAALRTQNELCVKIENCSFSKPCHFYPFTLAHCVTERSFFSGGGGDGGGCVVDNEVAVVW